MSVENCFELLEPNVKYQRETLVNSFIYVNRKTKRELEYKAVNEEEVETKTKGNIFNQQERGEQISMQ